MNHETWRYTTNTLKVHRENEHGCLPSPPDPRDFKFAAFAGTLPLPERFSRLNEMPGVRNQGNLGTCVGHAAWAVKEWQERQQKNNPAGGLSPAFIYALSKTLDGIPNEPGTYPRVALKVLYDHGDCPEKDFPYSNLTRDVRPEQPPAGAFDNAVPFKVSAYAKVTGIDELKRAIVEQGPVLAGVLVTESFVQAKETIPLPAGRILGGHAVCLCGYDDKQEAFLLMNSWGSGWGVNGFSWLPYTFVSWKTDDGIPAFFEAWACVDLPFSVRQAKSIVMRVGNKTAYVDGEAVPLDVSPVIASGRTLLPVRFIAERLGYIVNWQAETGVVELRKPN